jgi:hypothetical protein
MAGRLTLWGAGEFLRTNISRTAEPVPTLYMALCLTRPSPYITGLELDEPTIGSYARASIPNDSESWTDGDQLHVIIPYWALCNSEVEGYIYAVGALDPEEFIASGDQVVIDPGEISIELGPFFTDEDF